MSAKVKDLFEMWVVKQFGENTKALLKDYSGTDGYADQHINGLYLGFNGGFMVANLTPELGCNSNSGVVSNKRWDDLES